MSATPAQVALDSIVFFIMGLTPWLLVNGVFSELPILASTLPEKYSIAAYMVVSIQLGNIVAFIFAFTQSQPKTFVQPSRVVVAVYTLALSLAVLLGFFWSNIVAFSDGSNHSVALLILVFFCGVVGAVSMVSVFPFASIYGVTMIGALSAGSGANGLVPSILALIQGAESTDPRFSVQVFFFILAGVICLTLASFVWISLHHLPRSLSHSAYAVVSKENNDDLPLLSTQQVTPNGLPLFASLKPLAWPLMHECYISILQYILVGIMPFAFNGYGDASRAFLFWNTFAPIILGAFGRLVTIKTVMWAFILVQCFVSHDKSVLAWPIATIVCNALYTFLYGYEDTLNYQLVHVYLEPPYFERGSRFMGVANQVGAFLGSFTGFFLVQFVLS